MLRNGGCHCIVLWGSVRSLAIVFRSRYEMARWLSWLERRPVTAEVDGSNPFRVVSLWAFIMDGFPSGQRGQTVNLLSLTSVVRIHLHPLRHLSLIYIRGLSSAGRASALQAEGHRFEPYRPHLYHRGMEQSGSSSGS